MTTITSMLRKVLTLAVVALAVLFSFAINPGVAEAVGYCCSGDYKEINADYPQCEVDYAPGYEFTSAILTNEGNDRAIIYSTYSSGPIALSPGQSTEQFLPQHDLWTLSQGSGPVTFYCIK